MALQREEVTADFEPGSLANEMAERGYWVGETHGCHVSVGNLLNVLLECGEARQRDGFGPSIVFNLLILGQ